MRKWRAIAGVVLVFLIGALAGALVTHRICEQRMGFREEPRRMQEFIVERLGRELSLDAAQIGQLRTIVKDTHIELRNVRRQFAPQIQEILTRSQGRVRAILRPDQLQRYERIVAEQKRKRMGRRNDE